MHKRNRLFITLSLVYALLGGLLAIVWLIHPSWIPGDVARLHAHIMLLGFIAMMIYGVAFHVLPRFSGRALHSERLANVQLYLVNAGLWLMAAGWLSLQHWLIGLGGGLSWVGMALFSYNILRTVRHYGPRG